MCIMRGVCKNIIYLNIKNNSDENTPVMALLSGGGYAQFAAVNKDHLM